MPKHILVVAAHPDDEILGCGGMMAKHAKRGDKVHVVIIAEGITSRDPKRDREKHKVALGTLAKESRQANKVLGTASLDLHEFPDNRLDSVNLLDVIKVIEEAVDRYQPEIVYTHHAGDMNIDHRLVHWAVITACRPAPSRPVKTLLFFEVVSSTEWVPPGSSPAFSPNWFCDISDTLELKLKAMKTYQSEIRTWPHPRSIEGLKHLARWRGTIIGVEAAEAFVLGRNMES